MLIYNNLIINLLIDQQTINKVSTINKRAPQQCMTSI